MIHSLFVATLLAIAINLAIFLIFRLIWKFWPPLREVWPIIVLVWVVLCGMCIEAKAHAALPADPVQRVAAKALRGDYEELEAWQHKAYTYALAQNAQVSGVAWLTHYTPWEGFYRGNAVRWGQGCSERIAAAIMIDRAWYKGLPTDKRDRPGLDLSRQVWTGDYILTKLPTGWQVRRGQPLSVAAG